VEGKICAQDVYGSASADTGCGDESRGAMRRLARWTGARRASVAASVGGARGAM